MKLKTTINYSVCIYLLCILLIGCKSDNSNKKTEGFIALINSIPRLKLPITLYDTITLNDDKWGKEFDTNDVIKYRLLQEFKDTSYTKFPYKRISDYKCAPIGYFTNNGNIIFIYKTFTTEAGSGNPVIELAIFDNIAKKINCTTILTSPDQADPIYPYKGILTNHVIISDSNHFSSFEMIPSWPPPKPTDTIPTISELVEERRDYTVTEKWDFKNISHRDSILYQSK
jgi:hypothetical protein